MNIRFVMRYSVNYFVMNVRKFLGILFILFVTTLICGMVLLFYGETRYMENSMESVFSKNLEQIGVVQWEKQEEKAMQAWNHIRNLHEVENSAFFGNLYLKKEDSDLGKIAAEEIDMVKWIKVSAATVTMLEFVPLQGVKAMLPKDPEPGVWYLVLGSEYRQIGPDPGTKMVVSNPSGEPQTIWICGYLEEGSRWPDADFRGGRLESALHSMDYAMLAFCEEGNAPFFDKALLSMRDGESWEDLSVSVTRCFEQQKLSSGIFGIRNLLREQETKGSLVKNYLKKMMVLLVVVCFMMMISVHTVAALGCRKQFGIWYANGAAKVDAFGVLLVCALMVSLAAGVFAWTAEYTIAMRMYSVSHHACMKWAFWRYTLPGTGLLLILVTAVGVILPVRILRKYSLAELVSDATK